jgi:hypothetical protein
MRVPHGPHRAPKWPLRLQDGAASFIRGSLLQTDRPLEVLLEIDI